MTLHVDVLQHHINAGVRDNFARNPIVLAMVRAERVGWVIGIPAWDSVGTQLLLEEAKRLEKRTTTYSIPPHEQGGKR